MRLAIQTRAADWHGPIKTPNAKPAAQNTGLSVVSTAIMPSPVRHSKDILRMTDGPNLSVRRPDRTAPNPAVMFSAMAKIKISVWLKVNTLAAYIPPNANKVTRPSVNAIRASKNLVIPGMAAACFRLDSNCELRRPFSGRGGVFGTQINNGRENRTIHNPANTIVNRTGSPVLGSPPNSGGEGRINTNRTRTSAAMAPK